MAADVEGALAAGAGLLGAGGGVAGVGAGALGADGSVAGAGADRDGCPVGAPAGFGCFSFGEGLDPGAADGGTTDVDGFGPDNGVAVAGADGLGVGV